MAARHETRRGERAAVLRLRAAPRLLLPGALALLLLPGLLHSPAVAEIVAPHLRAYAAALLVAGLLLGWYFNRSRAVFALLLLAATALALRAAPGGGSGAVAAVLALLLPVNLAGYALLRERGLWTARGAARLAAILAQGAAVGLLAWLGPETAPGWLTASLLDPRLTAWTDVPQTGLAAFAASAVLLAAVTVARTGAIEAGLLWATASAFLALHTARHGADPLPALAAGGLAVALATVQAAHRMAYRDDLTGLPGRRALSEALLQVGDRYAVAMVDVDHFKRFNDTHGHAVGDQVLRMVAARLGAVSGGGRAYRYGGEEFTLLFPGKSADEALGACEAVRRAVAETRFVLRSPARPRKKPARPAARSPQRAIGVTVSIGVAEHDGGTADPQAVVKRADQALYKAKQAGRNRVLGC
jgi:diguanylate cyclase (GGDEF)-like protein